MEILCLFFSNYIIFADNCLSNKLKNSGPRLSPCQGNPFLNCTEK